MSVAKFSNLLAHLEVDAHTAAYNVGYLRAVIDEEIVGQKLDCSMSGRALTTATDAITRVTALYCARSWEQNAKFITVPAATKAMPSDEEVIAYQRTGGLQGDQSNLLAATAKRRAKALEAIDAAAKMPSHPYLRVMRSEWLAHRIEVSRDREKLESKDGEIRGVMYREIMECAAATVTAVGELHYFLNGICSPWPDRMRRAEEDCREFWRCLPVFRDVENL